jgi:hypothetical protein
VVKFGGGWKALFTRRARVKWILRQATKRKLQSKRRSLRTSSMENAMPLPFLVVLPREIRDLIYTNILANPQGDVRLYPWTVEVARSLSVLRTCKQIHRECKDIIWEHNKLSIRDSSQLFQKFDGQSRLQPTRRIQHVKICLELLDRDELEWMRASLKALANWSQTGSLKTITLVTDSNRPSTVQEFQEVLELRVSGEAVDGRLYRECQRWTDIFINTGWPRFSHWGKQSWLREMLLDPSGIEGLLREIHEFFGGELYIDGSLSLKNCLMVRKKMNLNPRNGEVKIVLPQRPLRQKYR